MLVFLYPFWFNIRKTLPILLLCLYILIRQGCFWSLKMIFFHECREPLFMGLWLLFLQNLQRVFGELGYGPQEQVPFSVLCQHPIVQELMEGSTHYQLIVSSPATCYQLIVSSLATCYQLRVSSLATCYQLRVRWLVVATCYQLILLINIDCVCHDTRARCNVLFCLFLKFCKANNSMIVHIIV